MKKNILSCARFLIPTSFVWILFGLLVLSTPFPVVRGCFDVQTGCLMQPLGLFYYSGARIFFELVFMNVDTTFFLFDGIRYAMFAVVLYIISCAIRKVLEIIQLEKRS